MPPGLLLRAHASLQVMAGSEHDEKAVAGPELRAHTLEFLPPLVIRNTLPCALSFRLVRHASCPPSEVYTVKPGGKVELCCINVSKEKAVLLEVTLKGYAHGKACSFVVSVPRQHRHVEHVSRPEHLPDSPGFQALFTVAVDGPCGQMTIEATSPCWVLNKSGVPLDVSGAHEHNVLPRRGPPMGTLHCPSTRGSEDVEMPVLLGAARVLLLPRRPDSVTIDCFVHIAPSSLSALALVKLGLCQAVGPSVHMDVMHCKKAVMHSPARIM